MSQSGHPKKTGQTTPLIPRFFSNIFLAIAPASKSIQGAVVFSGVMQMMAASQAAMFPNNSSGQNLPFLMSGEWKKEMLSSNILGMNSRISDAILLLISPDQLRNIFTISFQ